MENRIKQFNSEFKPKSLCEWSKTTYEKVLKHYREIIEIYSSTPEHELKKKLALITLCDFYNNFVNENDCESEIKSSDTLENLGINCIKQQEESIGDILDESRDIDVDRITGDIDRTLMLKNISESLEKEDYSTEVFTNLQDDEFKKCMENVLENLRTSSSDFLKKKIAQKVQKEILGLSSLINRESKSTMII